MHKETLNENVYGDPSFASHSGPVAAGEIDDNDLYNVASKDVVDRLNIFVKAISERAYVNPRTALARLRNKLQMVGYDTEIIPPLPLDEGSHEYSLRLNRFGGTFNPYTGKTDDNITGKSYNGQPINLQFSYQQIENGRFIVSAKLVSAGSGVATEETITPENEELESWLDELPDPFAEDQE